MVFQIKFYSFLRNLDFPPKKFDMLCKRFYSKNFSVTLDFNSSGGISGKICPFLSEPSISKTFNGIFVNENSKIKVSFIIDWTNKNLFSEALTCYTGVIFKYQENNECMLLKWLHINESVTNIGCFLERDLELMLDCSGKDLIVETPKILRKIPSDSLLDWNELSYL